MPAKNATNRDSPPAPGLHLAVLPGGEARDSQGPGAERPTLTWRPRTPVAAAFGVAALALAGWLVSSRPAATLRDLPAGERAALVDRTLANLKDVCHGADRPRDFCREQATMVLQLPECDGGCREEARDVLTEVTAVR